MTGGAGVAGATTVDNLATCAGAPGVVGVGDEAAGVNGNPTGDGAGGGGGGGGYTGVVGAGGTAGRENANPFTSGGGGGGGGSCAYAGDAATSFGTPPTAAAGPAGGAGGLSSQNTGSFASPGSAGTVTAVVNPAVVAPPVAAVPTMETWGLLAMGALLAGFGVRRVRKQG